MKTKFDSIVKIRKHELDACENELSRALSILQEAKELQAQARQKIHDFSCPNSLSAVQLREYSAKKEMITNDYYRIKIAIRDFELKIKDLRTKLQKAQMEYEKIEHLRKQNIKQMQVAIEKKQTRLNDDLANASFYLQKKVI